MSFSQSQQLTPQLIPEWKLSNYAPGNICLSFLLSLVVKIDSHSMCVCGRVGWGGDGVRWTMFSAGSRIPFLAQINLFSWIGLCFSLLQCLYGTIYLLLRNVLMINGAPEGRAGSQKGPKANSKLDQSQELNTQVPTWSSLLPSLCLFLYQS